VSYSDETPPTTTGSGCPVCGSRVETGSLFCAACGAFLKTEDGRRTKKTRTAVANGHAAEALGDYSLVQLLGEVAHLQRDLLKQFRQGQAVQARQFARALEAQALHLDKALSHAAAQVEASEQRLLLWQRWAAGIAAGCVFVIVLATQLV
jgi:predicted nucleic acid-binding Zn ribbon protein